MLSGQSACRVQLCRGKEEKREGSSAVSQGGASERGCSSLAAHLSSSSVNLHQKKIRFFKYYEYILGLEYISDVAYTYQK